jgi:rhomboid protease GluP
VQAGEWYRLFSAPLLHADIFHLALNCVVIWLAGRALENLIGRAWFATIFVIGALGGALFSLALNPDHIITVGASGAVTALFAATLVLSFHFPRGPARTGLILVAAYVLIPALLPLALLVKGQNVDYAAHFGGALGGTIVGLGMLALWPASEPYPRLRGVAAAIALTGLAMFAWSLLPVVRMIRI